MKLTTIIFIILVMGGIVLIVSPQTVVNFFNSQLSEGQQLTITGKLVLLENPPLGQIVLPVMVWGIEENVFSIPTMRTFYLSRDGHTIFALEDFTVGITIKAIGPLHIETDVNLNKVYLIEYTSLEVI